MTPEKEPAKPDLGMKRREPTKAPKEVEEKKVEKVEEPKPAKFKKQTALER